VAQIAGTWTRIDPAAAIAWAENFEIENINHGQPKIRSSAMRIGDARISAFRAIGKTWGSMDLDSALQYFENSALDEAKKTAQFELFIQKALKLFRERKVTEAVAYISKLSAKEFETGFAWHHASTIAQEWSRYDPVAAANWAVSLRRFGKSSALEMVKGWFRTDREATIDWATSLPEGDASSEVMPEVIKLIAKENIQEAVRLAEALTPNSGREKALKAVARIWAKRDLESVTAWIHTLPDDTSKKSVIASMVRNMHSENPQKAAEWLDSFGIDVVPESTLRHLGARWLEVDRDAATNWILQSPLNEEDKNTLLK